MGEFGNEVDANKIKGSAPGYIGYDNETGLIKGVKQYPNSVVLFDEVEKAHPAVFDVLLNILDTGILTDNKGNDISFRNTIIIFTTNLGFESGFSKKRGVGVFKEATTREDIEKTIKRHFRPEFINRLDEIITFDSLTNEVAETLIDRYVAEYKSGRGVSQKILDIKFNKADIEHIIEEANVEEFGARGLKREVRKHLLKVAKEGNIEKNKKEKTAA